MIVSCEKIPPGQFFTELANINDTEILSHKWTEFHNNSYEKVSLTEFFLAEAVNLCPPKEGHQND